MGYYTSHELYVKNVTSVDAYNALVEQMKEITL